MIKKISLIILLSSIVALGGCNIDMGGAKNNNSTQNSTANSGVSSTIKTNDKISLIIDKNCETAGIQQCNPQIWKQQFGQILGASGLEISYFNEKNVDTIKNIIPTSPVLVIPADKLEKFGAQAQGIKQQAKFVNNNYYIALYGWVVGEENLCNDGKDNNNDGKIDIQDSSCYKMTVLTSSKCTEQYCNDEAFKNMFMGYTITKLDINTDEGKQVYDKLQKNDGVVNLPVFLFDEEKKYMEQMKQLIKDTKQPCKYKKVLQIPQFKYDPNIEACASDCNVSPSCKKLLSCNKADKPNVELFVMAYCPYGTQAEKGILGAVNTLKNKINFQIKFVNYAMHGKKEIDENTLQYCVQKEEPTKYNTYLTCFLDKGDQKDCIGKTNLDMNKINTCIDNVKKEFKTEEDFNNKSTWLSGQFPMYRVHDDLNKKYGVQGSPTLIINGIKVQPSSRSPKAYLDAICKAFTKQPEECKKSLSNQSYDPMFGWTQNGKAAPAGSCGK